MKNLFCERLTELKREKNLTTLSLSKAINYSKTIVYYWEKGEREPTAQAIIALANFFECSTDYLLGRENDFGNIVVPGQSTDQLTAKEKRLLKAFGSLPDIEKNKLIEDAEFYALRHVKQEQH